MSAVREWMLAPPAKAAPKLKRPAPAPRRVYPDGTYICGVDMSDAPVMPDWVDNPADWPEWVRRRDDRHAQEAQQADCDFFKSPTLYGNF